MKPTSHRKSTPIAPGETPSRQSWRWKSYCSVATRTSVDADLADYFGSIPHTDLLKSVARRIVDRRVLHLIKMWLDCPVEETDQRGRKKRTTEARDNRRGIPQGSPLSPLLANLYMRRFVLGWKKLGLEQSLGTRLVTYADDLVILCRRGSAETALHYLREIMGKLKLTVNEEKTTESARSRKGSSTSWDIRSGGSVFPNDRQSPLGPPAVKEEHQAHGRKSPRADRPSAQLARDHRARRHVKPRASRVGQLLQCRHHQQSLSRARQLHGCAVAPVAANPSTRSGDVRAGAIHSRTYTGTSSLYA